MRARDMLERVQKSEGEIKALTESVRREADMRDTIMSALGRPADIGLRQIVDLYMLKAQMYERIQRVPKPEYRTILIERYFNGKRWEEIAKAMYYDLRYLYSMHGLALEALDKVIEEEEKCQDDQ